MFKKKIITAESASFTSRSRNRLCNKAAQEAIITGRGENWAAFTRAHIYKWVNKRGRLWAHKAVKSTVLLSAVASLNEDRLITLEAQIKLFKRIMRRNSRSSRQSDCKIWLKILWFYTPFPLCSPGKAQCATPLHRAPSIGAAIGIPRKTELNLLWAASVSPLLLWMHI